MILNFQLSYQTVFTGPSDSCFDSNQFPLYFEAPDFDVKIHIIKANSDQSFVFAGRTKEGSVNNATIGFYNNISPFKRVKWFQTYKHPVYQINNVVGLEISSTSHIYANFRNTALLNLLTTINPVDGKIIKAIKVDIDDSDIKQSSIFIDSSNNVYFFLNKDEDFRILKFDQNLASLFWMRSIDCDLGDTCKIQSTLFDSRLANSFLAGGSYEDANKNYLTIYGFTDFDNPVLHRWLYKAANDQPNKNVLWGIRSIEWDFVNNYIAGCYHTFSNNRIGMIFQQWGTTVFKNYELDLNNDEAVCHTPNFMQAGNQTALFYQRYISSTQVRRFEYFVIPASEYTQTVTAITTLGLGYLTYMPVSTTVWYDNTVYKPDIKLSYTLGHMTSPTYSTYASFIFAFIEDNRQQNPFPAGIKQIVQEPGSTLTSLYSEELGVEINEDLRKYQVKYSNTQGNCNLAGKLSFQYINGTYAFSERIDCYFEEEFCDMPIATYALQSSDLYTCQEQLTVNFQFLQKNDTSIEFASKNLTGGNEYSLSFNRTDAAQTSNIEQLKKYEIMVRASLYYPDDFQFAVDSSITFQLYYKSCFQEVKDSLYLNTQEQYYLIGNPELSFLYLIEQATLACGSFSQVIQINPSSTFITANQISKSISIQTNDMAHAGTYYVNIQLTFLNHLYYDPPDYNITYYTIKIIAKAFVKDNPPYFSAGQLEDQVVISGTLKKYKLPEVVDWENDDYLITLMSTSVQSFTTLIGDELVFNPSSIYVGTYKVEIKLNQKNYTSLQNAYRFKLTVLKSTTSSDPNQDGVEQENKVQSSDLYNPETDTWSDSKSSVFSGDDKIIKEYLKAKISYISATGLIFYQLFSGTDIEVTAIFSYQSSVYFIHLDSYDLASSVATAVSVTMSTVFGTNFVLNLILQNFSMSLIILLQWTKLVVTLEHV
eukprot:403338521